MDPTTDAARLTEIIEQMRRDLSDPLEFLDSIATQDGLIQWMSRIGRQVDVMRLYIGFGKTAEIRNLLASPDFRPHRDNMRDLDMEYADAALEGYELIQEAPADFWLEFAQRAVKRYRGRPPKDRRAMWEATRTRLLNVPSE